MLTLVKQAPKKNGICCPRCSSELVDTAKMALGNKKEVECLVCDFHSLYNTITMKLDKNF